MADNSKASSGGIGFIGLLTILFIGLKLGGVINWSWWLVLSPPFIGFGIGLVLIIAVLTLIALAKKFDR